MHVNCEIAFLCYNILNISLIKLAMNKGVYNLGVVGYCPPSCFDEDEARRMVREGFDKFAAQHPDLEINIVSGLTNVGVLKIAYEEATKRGWKTTGIACEKAQNYELFPVDEQEIVGKNWGDESARFVEIIDGILRVGGGIQSKKEVNAVIEKGGDVIEYELALIQDVVKNSVDKIIK